MITQSLCGVWKYRIGKGEWTEMSVPFSCLAVGHSEVFTTFDLDFDSENVFLKFDGITYQATVILNGKTLGTMLPYSEYTFDIKNVATKKDNKLVVELEDTLPKFGPTDGWENFGGIIRDVNIVYRAENYIEDVFFKSNLLNDYKDASFIVETQSTAENARYDIALYDGENKVCEYLQYRDVKTETLKNVKLWSPDEPNLYRLEVNLVVDGKCVDVYCCNVGFKELRCSEHRFVLNGKDIYLKGICKHEMVADSGHCPTYDQIYSDLKMIKDMGCVFVRLVHYPHNKVTLDIADSLGLMVSEEPGLWWSDTSDEEVASGSLEVLKRTILRDRNHVSVSFWLCFNECIFTEKFLVDSAETCRKYDPTRLVSGANCMSDEDTLIYYNKCGFDFYTMHPYAPTTERAKKSAKILNDKPLLFTEWGGFYVYNNPHLLLDFMTDFYNLYLQNSHEGALAGSFLWFFAELNDYNRGQPACTDGVLHEGIVDKYRNPTLIYDAFVKAMHMDEMTENETPFFFEKADGYIDLSERMKLTCVNKGADFDRYLDEVREYENSKRSLRKRVIKKGTVFEDSCGNEKRPYLAAMEKSVVFEGNVTANSLYILGLTSMKSAYPFSTEYGMAVCRLEVTYCDGGKDVILLRDGQEVTTSFMLCGSSRINPVAQNSKRYGVFGYDKNFEQYCVNILEIDVNTEKKISRVEFVPVNDRDVLIYDVFVK